MNFVYGIITALLVVFGLEAIQPADPIKTGFIMFFLGTIHGSGLILYVLKKRIGEESDGKL